MKFCLLDFYDAKDLRDPDTFPNINLTINDFDAVSWENMKILTLLLGKHNHFKIFTFQKLLFVSWYLKFKLFGFSASSGAVW